MLELIITLLILSLIIAVMAFMALSEIDKARGHVRIAEARMSYTAALSVIVESKAYWDGIDDYDYMEGLTGTVNDNSRPIQTKLSQMMNTLLVPDVILSDKLEEGTARLSFEIDNGIILKMNYETIMGTRHFMITIANGETIITRIK